MGRNIAGGVKPSDASHRIYSKPNRPVSVWNGSRAILLLALAQKPFSHENGFLVST